MVLRGLRKTQILAGFIRSGTGQNRGQREAPGWRFNPILRFPKRSAASRVLVTSRRTLLTKTTARQSWHGHVGERRTWVAWTHDPTVVNENQAGLEGGTR